MMNHLYLIKYLLNYDNYKNYRQYIRVQKDQREVYYLYKLLDKLIDLTKQSITYDDFCLAVLSNLGTDYKVFLSQIEKINVNELVFKDALQTIKEKELAFQLSQLAIDVSEGRKSVNDLKEFYKQFETLEQEEDSPFYNWDLKSIYERTIGKTGLRWRLRSLNESLGSLRKGDFGFIFARPETGKTTFLASEVTNFAEQVTAPILWFNNEQAADLIPLRWIQASLGLTKEELKTQLDFYYNEFKQKTNDNIKLIDGATLYKNEVERIVAQTKPSAIVFDQLDKIKGFNSDRDDLRLGSIYIWARELAKEYCPVIGVCQSDGSGEGKKWLTMDNVANAKTAKQAEADWILGIGATHDPGFERVRFFNISKNKLFGDEDTNPKNRHAKIEVLIKPEIARYEDI